MNSSRKDGDDRRRGDHEHLGSAVQSLVVIVITRISCVRVFRRSPPRLLSTDTDRVTGGARVSVHRLGGDRFARTTEATQQQRRTESLERE